MRANTATFLLLVILAASDPVAYSDATIYKCKNQQGKLIYQKTPCQQDAETVTSWIPVEKTKPPVPGQSQAEKKPAPAVLTLRQNIGGHYETDGSVNGKALSFIVDTGASYVSIPEPVAHEAQMYCDTKVNMITANGIADVCTTKITKLRFGPFFVQDVTAVIVPNLSHPLLGMNVLQLFKIAQENQEMKISVLVKEPIEP